MVSGQLWVALGSAVGGIARYGISGVVARGIGETFPWGTLVVNVSGCFVIGVFAAAIAPGGALAGSLTVRQLVLVGLCGGYTTFSSFSLQTLTLAQDGEWLWAAGNVIISVVLCLLAVWLGHIAAASLSGLKGA